MVSPGARILFVGSVGLVGCLPAQGLQVPTAVVAPAANFWCGWGASGYLPVGPVVFPSTYGGSLYHANLQLSSSPLGNALTVHADGQSAASFSATFGASTDLVTTVTTPSPARIGIQIQNALSYVQTLSTALPTLEFGVDVDADGQDEFFSNALQPTTSATLVTYCDAIGTAVRWHQLLAGGHTLGGVLQAASDLTLQFDNPTQEATYGPACEGSLGCQLGSGTYDRIFVASLPATTTYAWLMGSHQQWNVAFAGFTCPLLVNPLFILAVPLVDGPNGRKFVDFAATIPPVPGLTWYAQGIAVSNNTFIGTNGVRIQT